MHIYRERNLIQKMESFSPGAGYTAVHYTLLLKFLYVESDHNKLGKINRKCNSGEGWSDGETFGVSLMSWVCFRNLDSFSHLYPKKNFDRVDDNSMSGAKNDWHVFMSHWQWARMRKVWTGRYPSRH